MPPYAVFLAVMSRLRILLSLLLIRHLHLLLSLLLYTVSVFWSALNHVLPFYAVLLADIYISSPCTALVALICRLRIQLSLLLYLAPYPCTVLRVIIFGLHVLVFMLPLCLLIEVSLLLYLVSIYWSLCCYISTPHSILPAVGSRLHVLALHVNPSVFVSALEGFS